MLAMAMVLSSTAAGWPFRNGVAVAQSIREDLYAADGFVNAAVVSGNTLYIGGGFTQVGPATGGGVPIDASTGAPVAGFPKVAGGVNAVVPDGSGGWYIGGRFTAVGGIPRKNLAHILADHSVSDWNPNANGQVRALAMSGTTLYVGGEFLSPQGYLVALDATTGIPTAWNSNASGPVYALAVSGGTVWVGGGGAIIGGRPRSFLAAIDSATGLATTWDPYTNGAIAALTVSGTTLYVGGYFTSIGGKARNHLATLDVTTGLVGAWNPDVGGIAPPTVNALVVSGSTVYAGGVFNTVGGQARNHLASLDATTGVVSSWDPNPNDRVFALAVSGGTVYAGGSFTSIGGPAPSRGQARNHVAAVDAASGSATAWNPNVTGPNVPEVYALAVSGSTVYTGGHFTIVGGQVRHNLAALDLAGGNATAWNPNANNVVYSLAVDGTTVYAGGEFTSVGVQAQNYIAALDASSGLATAWNPDANGFVRALMVSGTTVRAGGNFTSIGGQPRNHIAALDASGLATDWSPDADNAVVALAESQDGIVYAGGYFTAIGGEARNYLAALDATSGHATTWNPNILDGDVEALALSGSTVYAGGYFTSIGGQTRNRIAALDASSGLVTAWDPNAGGGIVPPAITALALGGGTVYAGGLFTSIGGQARNFIAALDASSGLATAWDANAEAGVLVLTSSGTGLYAGGFFASVGSLPQSCIAAISQATVAVDPPGESNGLSLLIHSEPNPSRGSIHIRYSLRTSESVTLTIYDPAGRVVVTPVKGEHQAPGPHEVDLDERLLHPGVYMCQLQAGRVARATKAVVIQ